jgi:hypothetical protein
MAKGFDPNRFLCFFQSQIPQFDYLSRLIHRFVEGVVSSELACNSFRSAVTLSEVADMLMFRPEIILRRTQDCSDFKIASSVIRSLGHELSIREAMCDSQNADPEATRAGETDDDVCVRDILSFVSGEARIEAQKTFEQIREVMGLKFAMFG